MFSEYEFSEQSERVLKPREVRQSLKSLFQGKNGDYEEGNQGCAQETFQELMAYLHREQKRPDYLEQCLKYAFNPQARFTFDNALDDAACSPTCIAHMTFGQQMCEITTCSSCKSNEKYTHTNTSYSHLLYVYEVFEA